MTGGDVLPGGFPPSWLGANFEVHGLPTSARSTLSFAVRWHGERPAVLWEQTGPPVTLTARAMDTRHGRVTRRPAKPSSPHPPG